MEFNCCGINGLQRRDTSSDSSWCFFDGAGCTAGRVLPMIGRFRVLSERDTSDSFDGLQSQFAVRGRSREYDPNSVGTLVFGQKVQQKINGHVRPRPGAKNQLQSTAIYVHIPLRITSYK